jgi:hypothetical protein
MSGTITTTIEKTKPKFKVKLDKEYDDIALKYREEQYKRNETFKRYFRVHLLAKCSCKSRNNYCPRDIPFLQKYHESFKISFDQGDALINDNWVEGDRLYDTLEWFYRVGFSTHQSFVSASGKTFEDCNEICFKKHGLELDTHYAKQVYLSNDGIFKKKKDKGTNTGHTIDFMIPPPIWGSKKEDFKGIFISCKTTPRERVHQDKFLGKFTLITLDDYNTTDLNINVIIIKNGEGNLTSFIKKDITKLLTEYQLL